jgi:hypothetical protein
VRQTVTTSYRQAGKSPGLRRPRAKHKLYVTIVFPELHALSPCARYIEDNLDSGLPVSELLEQFQEYDCEHLFEQIAYCAHFTVLSCPLCGRVEKQER